MFSVKGIVRKIRSALAFRKGRSYGYGWRKLRKEHIKKYPYCAICGYHDFGNDVHHIEPRHLAPERLLDEDNLITLCRKYDCHLRFGHFGNYSKYYNPKIREMAEIGQLMIETEIEAKNTQDSV